MSQIITNASQLRELLSQDSSLDAFVQSMSRSDMYARKLVDRNEMYNRLIGSLVGEIDGVLMSRLSRAVEYCEQVLMRDSVMSGQLRACSFCLTRGELEQDMPFTLSSVVFLPLIILRGADGVETFRDMCVILVHEATHIFQRRYPKWASKLVEELWSFQPISDFEFRQLVANDKYHPRTNPDTAMQQYRLDDRVWTYCYTSPHPKDLMDGSSVSVNMYSGESRASAYEHPYEMMAYMMPIALAEGLEHDGFNQDPFLSDAYKKLHGFAYRI